MAQQSTSNSAVFAFDVLDASVPAVDGQILHCLISGRVDRWTNANDAVCYSINGCSSPACGCEEALRPWIP